MTMKTSDGFLPFRTSPAPYLPPGANAAFAKRDRQDTSFEPLNRQERAGTALSSTLGATGELSLPDARQIATNP